MPPPEPTDIGIWVCDFEKETLTPCLFMLAACPVSNVRAESVPWRGPDRPPKPFRGSGTASLLHGVGGSGPPPHHCHLHFFGPMMVPGFPLTSRLTHWEFPVAMGGIVVLLDKRIEETWGHRVLRRIRPPNNPTLTWVKAQRLPFLIAAMGYEPGSPEIESLLTRYGLTSDTYLVCGPLPEKELVRGRDTLGGLLPEVFKPGRVSFDQIYSQRIVRAARELVEHAR